MKSITLLYLILLGLNSDAQTSQDKITGTWWSEDKKGRTEIYKSNNKYFGKIVWLKEPNNKNGNPVRDTENPKPILQKRPVLKLVVLTNLVYDSKSKEWINGEVYDPESGKTYTCTVWLENGKLNLRGYWGWLYETQEWTRYN
jgi:uncharacterized protein (DUF2147 family)